ncbi:unnamed protein product [Phytophthora lilii]|uniref:Unnamed protein product n=1 Tax=Phytophthora lilii TaxID=2077276 RepID=A0A9W6TIN7_9STRA|nr:unnamed protein product [Phytophthora lilii]
MPPKPAERLKKELAAQKARAEALKYLQATGSGPSQRELSQQQQLRQKQTTNATSSMAQRRVLGAQPREPSAAEKFDPRIRDNTLHAVALRRAQELQKTQQIEQKTESYRLDYGPTENNALPHGWQEVVDPASGDTILKGCGIPAGQAGVGPEVKSNNAMLSSSTRKGVNSASTKRPVGATQGISSSQGEPKNKRQKRYERGDVAVDPTNPTGTGGKWSDELEQMGV